MLTCEPARATCVTMNEAVSRENGLPAGWVWTALRLRQSILKRAFAGRLVAQDANDEPAGALLSPKASAGRVVRTVLQSSRNRS